MKLLIESEPELDFLPSHLDPNPEGSIIMTPLGLHAQLPKDGEQKNDRADYSAWEQSIYRSLTLPVILWYDEEGLVLSLRRPSFRTKNESAVTAEIVSIPHLQFLEVITKSDAVLSTGDLIAIAGKSHPPVWSVKRKVKFSSLSKESRKAVQAIRKSEIRVRNLAIAVATSPKLASELGGTLEEQIKKHLGRDSEASGQNSRKIARKVIERYVLSNLAGNPIRIQEMILRGIYGPLARQADIRGLHYQH